MKTIVFFSGGMGSFAAAHRVFDENTHFLFTDTLIEHKTLYKFLLQSIEYFFKVDVTDLLNLVEKLTETEVDLAKRKDELLHIQKEVNKRCKRFHWIRYEVDNVGISPWDIFFNDNYVGNSRVANCSKVIKQRLARDYYKETFSKDDKVVLGIDWSESHRIAAPTRNWLEVASDVIFPLNEEPYIVREHKIQLLEDCNIDLPYLYKINQAHNNCGGFCVRGGHGHFANLLEHNPSLFDYHATQERELIKKVGKDVSILKRSLDSEVHTFTLDQLKNEIKNGKQADMFDLGGCGCFVTEDEYGEEYLGKKWGMRDLKVVY